MSALRGAPVVLKPQYAAAARVVRNGGSGTISAMLSSALPRAPSGGPAGTRDS